MNRTPEAVALMNAVADQIEAEPDTYDQDTYDSYEFGALAAKSVCGPNRHCIAGWACVLAGYDRHSPEIQTNSWRVLGAQLLGLPWNTELFYAEWEPAEGMTVPEALRKMAGGSDIRDVSNLYWLNG